MPEIYKLSKIAVRLVYKVRHHKGHGIHSPFVFKLITNVIEEKKLFYAYGDIKDYLNNFRGVKDDGDKVSRLLFRFVNFFKSKKILILGGGKGINTLYLTAASSDINCVCVEQSPLKAAIAKELYLNWPRSIDQNSSVFPDLGGKQDCVFIDLRNYNTKIPELIAFLTKVTNENSFVVIRGLRTNSKNRLLWKSLIARDEVIVSLDLFHLGIVFFDKKYHKKNYKLSF